MTWHEEQKQRCSKLVGKSITGVEDAGDYIILRFSDGTSVKLLHVYEASE